MSFLARVLAIYPAAVAVLFLVLPILAPRTGPGALASILLAHIAFLAVLLVPFAVPRSGTALRRSLLILAIAFGVRLGGEWVSVPPIADTSDGGLSTLSWNLELGARSGDGAVEALRPLDVDLIALQELGPDHAQAIEVAGDLVARFPARALYPDAGVLGVGLLSHYPIVSVVHATDPSTIEAVVDLRDRHVTVITSHPLPGTIQRFGPVPVGFDGTTRDAALQRIRARVNDAVGRGETVILLGDFNTAPTEAAFADLAAGLGDAHALVGQGPGWTWRPSSLEWLGLGFLRIDLALSGPGVRPVSVVEHCGLAGDHCQLEASYQLTTVTD